MAHEKGMRAPHYVFIGYLGNPYPILYKPWSVLGSLSPEHIQNWQRILREVNFKQAGMNLIKSSTYHISL